MVDDVLLAKAAIIERALARVRVEYVGHEAEFASELRRQDAIVLNLQRACQAAIDGAMHWVRTGKLGLPQDSREAFSLLEGAGRLPPDLATALKAMVGFRNIAIHDYQSLNLVILRRILRDGVLDLERFARRLVEEATAALRPA